MITFAQKGSTNDLRGQCQSLSQISSCVPMRTRTRRSWSPIFLYAAQDLATLQPLMSEVDLRKQVNTFESKHRQLRHMSSPCQNNVLCKKRKTIKRTMVRSVRSTHPNSEKKKSSLPIPSLCTKIATNTLSLHVGVFRTLVALSVTTNEFQTWNFASASPSNNLKNVHNRTIR